MPILVQKFGGTSVADAHRIHLAARRAVRAKLRGNQVVLVLSAMGSSTDELVDLARQVSKRPAKREMDMLLATGEQISIALMAMAIHEAGHEAVSMTGAQAGLLTDCAHSAARIQSINTDHVKRVLNDGKIVIVAGFQGVDADFNVTTLGRGGSDTTAVALAAALSADLCEIYTDVAGVYTADPRLVPTARKLDALSYAEMLELAGLGAGILHSRAMELGKKYNVPIHVRSSLADSDGTRIMNSPPGMEDVVVRGATLKRGIGRVTLIGLPNQPDAVAEIFDEIATRGINVDDIIQTVADQGRTVTLAFTVAREDLDRTRAVAEQLSDRFRVEHIDVADRLAKVSIVGVGMRSHQGVAARMFRALAGAEIALRNISTSEIVISVLVHADDAEKALCAVHEAFELDRGD